VKIYPNPSSDILIIQNTQNEKIKYSINSLQGQLISTGFIQGNTSELLNINDFESGIYLIKIQSDKYCNYFNIIILK